MSKHLINVYFLDILICSFQGTVMDINRYLFLCQYPNGDKGIRTLDPLLARQVLSHLSYTPTGWAIHFL